MEEVEEPSSWIVDVLVRVAMDVSIMFVLLVFVLEVEWCENKESLERARSRCAAERPWKRHMNKEIVG